MKTILLAVEGMAPNKKAIEYALTICNPIRAGLDILQIIRPKGFSAGLSEFEKRVRRARDAFENTMVAATYAEAGVPELAGTLKRRATRKFKGLLPSHMDTAVDYHCVVTIEDPDALVMRYVDEHRNVILAIYDTLRVKRRTNNAPEGRNTIAASLLNGLSIPLVFVRDL